jgi:hypothetical protein
MPTHHPLLAACVAAVLLAAPSAHALELIATEANGHDVSLAFSTPQVIAADIGFVSPGSVTLTYVLDADDVARGTAAFNGILDNFTGGALGVLTVSVSAGGLGVGAFASNDGGMAIAAQEAKSVMVSFSPLLETQAYLGDPFFTGTASDWTMDLAGLAAGDSFSVTVAVAVPEPRTWAMLAGGLGLLGLTRHRRR